MRSRSTFLAAAFAALLGAAPIAATAQTVQPAYAANPGDPSSYNSNELIESGHQFFGSASRGLALALQEAIRRWGEPNGYILGQEASGAFFGGLRYGEGKLFTRNAGERRIFWQGPSIGFDVGGEGARTMMLVYNMPYTDAMFRRFVGIDGSAYLIGGFGVTAAAADEMVVVPIRAGVGARLGVNMGYLKFTPEPTWNPF
ncbi:DUF1134 domain-containing protein [Microvirga roseola]|uniref:DUF1134 domain-containing protein n=1 Tax=Microvirga roseola TaxID=2883126 RepID=UPI001E5AF62B|nr:DUF1134 domain-containing protein [Microvirga roseola]